MSELRYKEITDRYKNPISVGAKVATIIRDKTFIGEIKVIDGIAIIIETDEGWTTFVEAEDVKDKIVVLD